MNAMKIGTPIHDHADPSRNGCLVRYWGLYAVAMSVAGKRLFIPMARVRIGSRPKTGRRGVGTVHESRLASMCGLTVRQVREALS